ncbi:protocatechuate 3,4-dioxygenase subunit alpha [Radicibacter daui]|uniref:protocatechuate 3,4-dioxygenase subunit alpha n=1 Tax=Radicibacter daui TaxID=3064829 RepID=UPI004046BD82
MTETATRPEGITPSQTVGPFFAYALTPHAYDFPELVTGNLLAGPDAGEVSGERITITGRLFDAEGNVIPDAMIEIWQADGEGRFAGHDAALSNSAFRGFGRVECEKDGRFTFTTVKPGPLPGPDGGRQAPHVNIGLFARGLLNRLFTRFYFSDDAAAHGGDPVLALVPADQRATLIATRGSDGGKTVYNLDIHLGGGAETVFFEA